MHALLNVRYEERKDLSAYLFLDLYFILKALPPVC